jgi:hypothetical protein
MTTLIAANHPRIPPSPTAPGEGGGEGLWTVKTACFAANPFSRKIASAKPQAGNQLTISSPAISSYSFHRLSAGGIVDTLPYRFLGRVPQPLRNRGIAKICLFGSATAIVRGKMSA